MKNFHILALDQGTTSSRAILYNSRLEPVASARREFAQSYPEPGRVEHDALEIWETILECAGGALGQAGISPDSVAAIGITNQRETVVVWDRVTGRPVGPAIVWQDRRTAEMMHALRAEGREEFIRERTGLLLDPYFSAAKIRWILRNTPGAARRAAGGELAAGTIDSWLLWKLTGGKVHATDVSNASRTMLMDLRTGQWDPELLDLFEIPRALLPEILPSGGVSGSCGAEFPCAGARVCGVLGDQQAALFRQLCNEPGMVKCTYGTGCFLLEFTGPVPIRSSNRLLGTVAWRIGAEPVQYALEGSVFTGGAAIQWLRDGLGLIRSAPEINDLAARVPDSGGVVMVPAFTGLGAPHWDAAARGTILGLTRGTTAAHLARATLDGIAFQVADLLDAMTKDSGHAIPRLRVDGGACASDPLMQIQADLLGIPVERPMDIESTALGAAMMAGIGAGIWPGVESLSKIRKTERVFEPRISPGERRERLRGWHDALGRVVSRPC